MEEGGSGCRSGEPCARAAVPLLCGLMAPGPWLWAVKVVTAGHSPSRKGQLPCGRAAHLAFQAPFVQQANLGGQIPSSPVQSPAGVSLAAHGAPNPVDGFSILMWALGGAAWTWGPAGGRA